MNASNTALDRSVKPDDCAANWPQSGKLTPLELHLASSREEWRSESLTLAAWLDNGENHEPLPVARLLSRSGELQGIIHLRRAGDQFELNLSLLGTQGAWQTGAWLQVSAADDVALSWCTDWRSGHLSAISLEICPQEAVH